MRNPVLLLPFAAALPVSDAPFSPSAAKIPLPVISLNLEPEQGFLALEAQKNWFSMQTRKSTCNH